MTTGLILILEAEHFTVLSPGYFHDTECVCSPVQPSTPYLSSYLTAWSMGRYLMILWDGIPFTHTTRVNGNQQGINRERKVTENENKVSCASHSGASVYRSFWIMYKSKENLRMKEKSGTSTWVVGIQHRFALKGFALDRKWTRRGWC